MANTVAMTPEARKLHGAKCAIGKAKGQLRLAKTEDERVKFTAELARAEANYAELAGKPYAKPGTKDSSMFKENEIVIYKKGSSFEIGRIKRLTDTGAFVYYSRGDTAAKTPYDHLFKLDNAGCIDGMQLGWYADQDDPPFQFDMKEDDQE